MRHDEPKHGGKDTLPAGKTRNAIFRNIQAKTHTRTVE